MCASKAKQGIPSPGQAGAQPSPGEQGSITGNSYWEDKHHHSKRVCVPFFPQLYMLSMTLYGMEYPFGQFGSILLAVPLPSQLVHLAENGNLEKSFYNMSTTQQQLHHQCVINTIFIISPKHSTLQLW